MPAQKEPEQSKTAAKSDQPQSSSFKLSEEQMDELMKEAMQDAALGIAIDKRRQQAKKFK